MAPTHNGSPAINILRRSFNYTQQRANYVCYGYLRPPMRVAPRAGQPAKHEQCRHKSLLRLCHRCNNDNQQAYVHRHEQCTNRRNVTNTEVNEENDDEMQEEEEEGQSEFMQTQPPYIGQRFSTFDDAKKYYYLHFCIQGHKLILHVPRQK